MRALLPHLRWWSILLIWGLLTPVIFANDSSTKQVINVFVRDDINQVELFTNNEVKVQRILAISSATTSILFCLISMYCFLAIDPKRLVFRHQLIFFLLFFDLLKAGILLLYPTRVLTTFTAYFNTNFCHVVGFFTATAIEGADIAILTFAIHTYLLIFRPSMNVKVGNTGRVEGGLYTYRHYIYGTSFLIPIVLASLAFIRQEGYHSFVCWCYLPQSPVWYRMVLSWGPRFAIVMAIFTSYSLIYFHVIREYRVLGSVFNTLPRRDLSSEEPTFFSALKYFLQAAKFQIFPNLDIPDEENYHHHRRQEALSASRSRIQPSQSRITREQNLDRTATETVDFDDLSSSSSSSASTDDNDVNEYRNPDDLDPITRTRSSDARLSNENRFNTRANDIQLENLRNFRKRQKIIKKQMKSIFVYPVAYIFVWTFPFILYCTQINHERQHGPIYWLNCMGAFMQPLNGLVDSLVFFYREQPWKYTVMKKFEKDHGERMDLLLTKSSFQRSHSMYDSSILTGYRNQSTTSADYEMDYTDRGFHHNSLSADLGVDMTCFSRWRRKLNQFNLPLFQLPTENNLAKFQKKHIKKRAKENEKNSFMPPEEKLNQGTHDFSNILKGALTEPEFRSTLENFSLNFDGQNKNPMKHFPSESNISSQSQTRVNSIGSPMNHQAERKSSIISQKSFRGRQHSIVDPNEPVILEGQPYDGVPDSPTSPVKGSPTSARVNRANSYNSVFGNNTGKRGNSGSSTPSKKLSKATLEDSESEDEMDFMDFLRRGPPS